MRKDLETTGRPFGEFLTGGNAAKPGQIDEQIAIVRQLEIQGKKVAVPSALKGRGDDSDGPASEEKAKRKVRRDARKRARQAGHSDAKPNG